MLESDSYGEQRIGKRYDTKSSRTLKKNGCVEDNSSGNSSENTEVEVPEIRILFQEAVNEQIKVFIPQYQVSQRKRFGWFRGW